MINEIRSRTDALSPVISFILVIAIVTSTIGTIMVWGGPFIDKMQSDKKIAESKLQASVLSDSIDDLVNSEVDESAKTKITLPKDTSISVNSKFDRVITTYCFDNGYDFNVRGLDDSDKNFSINMGSESGTCDWLEIDWLGITDTCFISGTHVLMADGSYKDIEDVNVGDAVKSYDEQTKAIMNCEITHVFDHTPNEMPDYYLRINDQVRVTPNHRFYSNGDWVYAGSLKVGDSLFCGADNYIYRIYSIKRVYERVQTFDLEVEYSHTYFVLFDNDGINVLVHNPVAGSPPNPPISFTATAYNRFRIDLRWTKGRGTNIYTYIVAKLNSYPTSRTDGTNIYNNTGTSFSHTGLSPSQHWYYRAWSWNATSKTWSITYASADTSTLSNSPPSYGTPSPTNGSTNQPLSLIWWIPINDANGDSFNYWINCSNGQKTSATGSSNGTKSLSISGLTYSKTYKVWVNSTDGYDWTRKWYTFTTHVNNPPNTPSNPNPANGATDIPVNAVLSWTCTDPDVGDTLKYDVYFGTATPPNVKVSANQSGTSYDPGTMNYNTHYYWKIVAWDNHGASAAGPIWDFTTENRAPNTPSSPNPANGATEVGLRPTLSVDVSDPDGDQMDVEFWQDLGMLMPPALIGTTEIVGQGTATINWPETLPALQRGIKFSWYVVVSDGNKQTTSATWSFTTTVYTDKINVNSPGSNYKWTKAALHKITWSYQGSFSGNEYINITVYRGSDEWQIVKYPSELVKINDPDGYDWGIPYTYLSADDYWIEISTTSPLDHKIITGKSGYFSIVDAHEGIVDSCARSYVDGTITAKKELTGTVVMDLYSNDYYSGTVPFGRIRLFDSNSLVLSMLSGEGISKTSIENGGTVTSGSNGGYSVENSHFYQNGSYDIFSFSVSQMEASSIASFGGGGACVVNAKYKGSLIGNWEEETQGVTVTGLKLQFYGDNKDAWYDFIKINYHFSIFEESNTKTLEYPIDQVSSGQVKFILLHSLIDYSLSL